MRVTKNGVFFDSWCGSNTSAPNGRIHFTDTDMVEVYLNPGILASQIAICARDFKCDSPEIDRLVTRLNNLGKEHAERERTSLADAGWKAAPDEVKQQLLRGFVYSASKDQLEFFYTLCRVQLASLKPKRTRRK